MKFVESQGEAQGNQNAKVVPWDASFEAAALVGVRL